MAVRDVEFGYDQLNHFVAQGVRDSAPLEAVRLKEADRPVGDGAGYRPLEVGQIIAVHAASLNQNFAVLGTLWFPATVAPCPRYAQCISKL